MDILRLILLPFSMIFGIITTVRNKLFDWKIISSFEFELPIISVGNLSMGGTGKSPHIEYLIRLLKEDFKSAVLSRGYKRKTSGFILTDKTMSQKDIGDEPMQFYTKFSNVSIAVDERRVRGVRNLLKIFPDLEVILLDDAYQHRYVKPGLSILLTDFHKLYSNDYPVPTGSLREFRAGAKRADIIIVTKTPSVLSPIIRRSITEQLKPDIHQKLYFSHIKHGGLKQIPGVRFNPDNKTRYNTILMVAGIVNTYPMEEYLRRKCDDLEIMNFPDHHQFSSNDVEKIVESYDNILSENKIIVTTEKDVMRLSQSELINIVKSIPICYLPIEIVLHKEDQKLFNQQILDYVKTNKGNNGIHKE